MLATAKARPQTARPAKADATGNARVTLRESLSGRGPRVGDRTLDADPYGRGTRRGRRGARLGRRRRSRRRRHRRTRRSRLRRSKSSHSRLCRFRSTPPRAGTVRINAWDTRSASAENERERKRRGGEGDEGDRRRRRRFVPLRAPRRVGVEARRRRLARRARGGSARVAGSGRARARRARPRGGGAGGARRVGRGDTDSKRTEGEDVHARVSGGGVRRGAGGRGRAPRGWQRLVPPGRRPRRHRDVHGGSGARPGRRRGARQPRGGASAARRRAAAERDASACLSLDASTRRRCIAEPRRGPAWGTTKAR